MGGFNQLLLTCILPNLILFPVLHPTIIYGKHRNLTAEKYVCLELGKSWLDDKIICGKALKAESKSNHIWQHWNSLNKYLKTCLTIQTNTNVLCKIWNVQVLLNQQKLEKFNFRNTYIFFQSNKNLKSILNESSHAFFYYFRKNTEWRWNLDLIWKKIMYFGK